MNISLDDALRAIQQHIDEKKNSHTDSLAIVACADYLSPIVFPFNRVKSSDTFEPYHLGKLPNSCHVISPHWSPGLYERRLFPPHVEETEKKVLYDVVVIKGITYNLVPQD